MPRGAEVALLLLAIGAAYANALGASFQFDDWDVIVRDARVQDLAAWWRAMPGIRPLLKLTYALDHTMGFGVVGFHATNVAIHGLASLAALTLTRRLVARHRSGATEDDAPLESVRFVSLVAALVFALHPVQTEAVTLVNGRSSALSTALAFASLLLWSRSNQTHGTRAQAGRAFSLVAMVLALGVKETAVVVPLVVGVWVATTPGFVHPWREALRASALHGVTALACLGAAAALPAYRDLVETSLATRSPLENVVAQLHTLGPRLRPLVDFEALNSDPALEASTRLDAGTLAAGVVVATLLASALVVRRRHPLATFAVAWTFVWLAPTSSFLARLDLVNDRQWYAALLGPAILFGLAADSLRRRLESRRSRWAGAASFVALLVLGLGFATHARNRVYADEVVFWQDVVRKSPGNARAYNNLGIAQAERCALAKAREAWRRALELDPGHVRAAVNLRLLDEGRGYARRCHSPSALEGHVPLQGRAPHDAPLLIVGDREVLNGAIVPEGDRIGLPAKTALEARLVDVLAEELDQRVALGLRETFDPLDRDGVEVERLASAPWMRAHERMGDRRPLRERLGQ